MRGRRIKYDNPFADLAIGNGIVPAGGDKAGGGLFHIPGTFPMNRIFVPDSQGRTAVNDRTHFSNPLVTTEFVDARPYPPLGEVDFFYHFPVPLAKVCILVMDPCELWTDAPIGAEGLYLYGNLVKAAFSIVAGGAAPANVEAVGPPDWRLGAWALTVTGNPSLGGALPYPPSMGAGLGAGTNYYGIRLRPSAPGYNSPGKLRYVIGLPA